MTKYEGGGQARYEIIPDEARVVRQVFAWVGGDRLTIGEVCRRLTQAGERTRTDKTVWDRSVVWGILKNPASQGAAAFGKTRLEPLRPRLRAAQPARTATPCRLRPGCSLGGLEHDPRASARGARALRGCPGAVAREQAPWAAIAPRRPVSAARRAPMPAVWVGLRWQTPQSERPQRPPAGLRLLPLSGDGCLPLWR